MRGTSIRYDYKHSFFQVQTLEKQVEILTNLVNAQSSIINKISCIQSSNPISECNLKIADQAKKIVKIDGDLASLHSLVKTKEKVIRQLQSTVTGQLIKSFHLS